MAVFELIITLLFVGAVLAAVARRLSAPYPALLALAGAAGSLIATSFFSRRSASYSSPWSSRA